MNGRGKAYNIENARINAIYGHFVIRSCHVEVGCCPSDCLRVHRRKERGCFILVINGKEAKSGVPLQMINGIYTSPHRVVLTSEMRFSNVR